MHSRSAFDLYERALKPFHSIALDVVTLLHVFRLVHENLRNTVHMARGDDRNRAAYVSRSGRGVGGCCGRWR